MNLISTVIVLGLLAPLDGRIQGQLSAHHQDDEEGYEELRERELGGMITRLREHAEWCKKNKLWLQRSLAYEALLQFDPDDEGAHRGLGHKKLKDGSWVAGKRPKPVDRSKRDLEEAETRRKAIAEPFVAALQGLYERQGDELPAPLQERLIKDVLAVDPENVWAHGLRLEVKHEGAWVMMEVANTAGCREELAKFEALTREELEPAAAKELTSLESGLELSFTAALERSGVRVVGTVEEEELQKCAENLRVARTLLCETVGSQCAYSSDFTYFLLKNSSEQAVFLSNHPMVEDADRAFYLALESVTLKGARHFGSWSDSGPRRLDSACRQGISNLLYYGHELTAEHGWAFEGVGLYFTNKVTRTNLTWFVAPSRYMSADDDAAFRAKLSRRNVDWLDEARLLLKEGKFPKFHSVVGRSVNRLSTEDLLLCNAVIAYFVEGRPGALSKILKKLGRGRTAHEIFLEELGLDLLQFDERLRRWLVETAD
jgi:hypothetical protein